MPDIQLGNLELALVLFPVFWVVFFFMFGGGRVHDTEHPGSVRIAIAVYSLSITLLCISAVIANVISDGEETLSMSLEIKALLVIGFLGLVIFFVSQFRIATRLPIIGKHFLAYQLMTLRRSAKETARAIAELEELEREQVK
ncbi:hypothetical protein [Hyphococcus sp.]|uniref:hypothetical protein n=1 Tax=Hyphococcus sp. TaxID=2038636 RepID=UPI0035C6CB27